MGYCRSSWPFLTWIFFNLFLKSCNWVTHLQLMYWCLSSPSTKSFHQGVPRSFCSYSAYSTRSTLTLTLTIIPTYSSFHWWCLNLSSCSKYKYHVRRHLRTWFPTLQYYSAKSGTHGCQCMWRSIDSVSEPSGLAVLIGTHKESKRKNEMTKIDILFCREFSLYIARKDEAK